jgi:hypothetical protein
MVMHEPKIALALLKYSGSSLVKIAQQKRTEIITLIIFET